MPRLTRAYECTRVAKKDQTSFGKPLISSRGSHILKTLSKHKSECIDIENENEEVISPEVRVGPAEKENHSVSMIYDNKIMYLVSIAHTLHNAFRNIF